MKSDPLVSVLMSIYKESVAVVSRAIDSIREQTYRNLELVVLLDYPEHEEMKRYLAKLQQEEARLQYHVNEKNLGLLFSLNRGVAFCQGELICRMDEDDYAEPDRVEKQVAYMQEHGLDLVGSYINLMDMDGNLIDEVRKYPTKHENLGKYLRYTNAIPHPTWLVKKKVYEQLGGYRDIDCADDYDFLIRAYMNGYRLGVVPEPLHRYRINRNGMTQRNIASQKVVSEYLADQLKNHKIYTVEEIAEYRAKMKPKENKLIRYYSLGKKWKRGESLTLAEKCGFLFNRHNFVEARQRMMCKQILLKDQKYGNY